MSYNSMVKYCGESGLKRFFNRAKCLRFHQSYDIVRWYSSDWGKNRSKWGRIRIDRRGRVKNKGYLDQIEGIYASEEEEQVVIEKVAIL